MNRTSIILLLSLAANLALGPLVYQRLATPQPLVGSAARVGGVDKTVAAARRSVDADPASRADRELGARLQATGMPRDLIRAVVSSRVQQRYRDRFKELEPANAGEYWRSWSQMGWASLTPEGRARYRGLIRQVEAEIQAALGDGPDALGPSERRLYDQLGGMLSADKTRQLAAIERDYSELAAHVREQARGVVLKADREKLRLLEQERRKDLAAAFSPEELLEYELRASPTANALRHRLIHFGPSEAEYRALGQLHLELDRQFPPGNLSGEESDRRHAAQKALLPRIEAVLSPERFAEYQVTIDGMYSETRSFVGAYGLDPAVAKEIVALKQQAWRRVDELDAAGATAEQRQAALQALEREVEGQLEARLGAELLARYKRSGASWLKRLQSAPPPGT